MDLYCTSKSIRKTDGFHQEKVMIYLGPSLEEAMSCIGELSKYEAALTDDSWKESTALPRDLPKEIVKIYFNTINWASIFKITFN